jgi:hypothetical protein
VAPRRAARATRERRINLKSLEIAHNKKEREEMDVFLTTKENVGCALLLFLNKLN